MGERIKLFTLEEGLQKCYSLNRIYDSFIFTLCPKNDQNKAFQIFVHDAETLGFLFCLKEGMDDSDLTGKIIIHE